MLVVSVSLPLVIAAAAHALPYLPAALLEPGVFIGGLVAFLIALTVWLAVLGVHFRRDAARPKPTHGR